MKEEKISYPDTAYNSYFEIEDKSFWFLNRNKIISYHVSKYLKRGDSFFDLGGGNGFVSRMLQDGLGLDVTLVEPGSEACVNAEKRGIKKIIKGVFQSVQVQITNVGLFDVIEHIDDDLKFLSKINQNQTSKSYVFITVPAYNFLWSDEDAIAGHFRRYNVRKLKKLLRDSNYEIVETIPFFSPLLLPIFFMRSLPFRLGLIKSNDLSEVHAQGLLTKILIIFLKLEIWLIEKGWKSKWGASILLIGQKS